MGTSYSEWKYETSEAGVTGDVVGPAVLDFCRHYPAPARVLDVGCGSGYILGLLLQRGYTCVGIDLSESGIAVCRNTYPNARFEVLAADEQVLNRLGEAPFDIVISTETVEHLYDPAAFARGCFAATRAGGRFICSTPYHGYLKNLAIALTNKWDWHMNPMWLGGHIKFWSRQTLTQLLRESGYTNIQFRGTGRVFGLWKSMVMAGDRPVT